MVAGRPWYAAYPADFFMATQGWDLESKGAYRLIIDLLNERDRPIPDEPKFLAGILGCSVQRWKKLRDRLLDDGKLCLTPDGLHLTNPRFEREQAERTLDRAAAVELGRAGGKISAARRAGQTDLPGIVDPSSARPRAVRARTEDSKTSIKVEEKSQLLSKKLPSHSQDQENKPNEINGSIQAPPQAPCAGVRDQSLERVSTHPISANSRTHAHAREDPGRLGDADLKTLYDEVCEAAGFCPTMPAAIDRAMSQVEKWRELGADFDTVVLPAIHAVVLASEDPTRTLGRFNARVLHEHAKFQASAKKHVPYEPPEIPHLNPEGEDPAFFALRTDLLERCGDRAYCLAFNRITFEDTEPSSTSRPLRLRGPVYLVEPLQHGRWAPILLAAAREMGFTEIWK